MYDQDRRFKNELDDYLSQEPEEICIHDGVECDDTDCDCYCDDCQASELRFVDDKEDD